MGNPVIHFDISGTDPGALERFYSDLFGWKLNPIPGMGYSIAATPGGSIDGGIGPAWKGAGQATFYIQVDDVQSALDTVESLGGATWQPPQVIPDLITLGMFTDPAGNPVGLSKPAGPRPRGDGGAGVPVTWFEAIGPDSSVLEAFYTKAFGWTTKRNDLPGGAVYYEVDTGAGRGISGGIGSDPAGGSRVTVYAEPGDLQACLDKAASLGGTTILPILALPGGPTIALFADPEGHQFGIYS